MKKNRNRSNGVLVVFSAIIAIGGFALAYQFIGPPPPKTITIATGGVSGAYYRFAEQYAAFLKAKGITLNIVQTSGSIDNLARLRDPETDIDVAFVQGGIAEPEKDPQLLSLASLYHEPLWIFHRRSPAPTTLGDLKDLRIAAGAEGSGTRAFVEALLIKNGIALDTPNILTLSNDAAADQLDAGTIDMALMVSGISSPLVQGLLRRTDIQLLSLDRAEAYTRIHRFLDRVILPKGMLDFQKNLPPQDIQLIAPVATLVAKDSMHPALIDLLLQAASSIHAKADALQDEEMFPSRRFLEYPLSPDADRYFKYGPPFLQRFLPFWIATLVDRLKVLLIPIIVLLLPLCKAVPPALRWRTRKRIYRWYRDLQDIDMALLRDDPISGISGYRGKLTQIEREVAQLHVPLSYADQLYNLRLHIALIHDKIKRLN